MHPYRTLEATYRRLTIRRAPWAAAHGLAADLDDIVAAIRDDFDRPRDSDAALRTLLAIGRDEPDAITVALHALAPALRRRIATTATVEYHTDALAELAFVLLDSDLRGDRLAHRLVNRAHSRAWRHARRAQTHGTRNITTTVPCPPERLGPMLDHTRRSIDLADAVAARVDLGRFAAAVEADLAAGVVTPETWQRYRDQRLRRAVNGPASPSSGSERVALHRASRRLAPYIDRYLATHVA